MYKQKIILFFSFIFTSFFLLVTLTYFLYMKYPPYKPVEYWVKEAIILKERYLNTIEQSKIIIFSGSNSLFSLCTPLLKEKTNKGIVNFGLTCYLPIEVIFKLIEKNAKPNDIILMPLEYAYYIRDKKLLQYQIDILTTWASEYIKELPITEIVRIILLSIPSIPKHIKNFNAKVHIRSYEEYIKDKKTSAILARSTLYKNSFNVYGDMLYDSPSKLTKNYSYFAIADLKNFRFKQLKKFSNFLAKNNIKLLLTYPVSVRNPDFDLSKKEHLKKIEAFNQKCEEYDLKFIGKPELSNYDFELSFDAPYHLNAEGAMLRSLYFADMINCYLAGIPQEIPDLEKYKTEKKAEAKKYLNEYRKLGYFSE